MLDQQKPPPTESEQAQQLLDAIKDSLPKDIANLAQQVLDTEKSKGK